MAKITCVMNGETWYDQGVPCTRLAEGETELIIGEMDEEDLVHKNFEIDNDREFTVVDEYWDKADPSRLRHRSAHVRAKQNPTF